MALAMSIAPEDLKPEGQRLRGIRKSSSARTFSRILVKLTERIALCTAPFARNGIRQKINWSSRGDIPANTEGWLKLPGCEQEYISSHELLEVVEILMV